MRIVIILILFPFLCFSQVGINTTNPEASLDIRSSNQATPTNTDGILVYAQQHAIIDTQQEEFTVLRKEIEDIKALLKKQ